MSRPVNGTALRGPTYTTSSKFGSHAMASGAIDVTGVDAAIVASGIGTFEMWVKIASSGTVKVFGDGDASSYWLGFQGDKFVASWPSSGGIVTTSAVITDGSWHHIAIVFTLSDTNLYCDGNRVNTAAASTPISGSATIGGFSSAGFDADTPIDEVRWSSVARYTGTTYTTPPGPFANDSDTLGLYHLDNALTDDTSAGGPTVPDQVTGLGATPGNAQVALAWSAPSDGGASITDYTVEYRATLVGGSWTVFSHSAGTGTSRTVTGLTNGTGYDFRVSAVNSVGTGTPSSTATGTPTAGATAPGQVTGLSATPGAAQVALSWSAPASDGGSSITDYTVEYRATLVGGSWTAFSHSASTATSRTVTGLTNGTGYDFRVSAVNGVGTGTPSSTATGTPSGGTTFGPDDTNIIYSPYNWDVTSARAKTMNSGAYLRTLITGGPTGIAATFDTASVTSTPKLSYRVDDGPWTDANLASSVTLTIPSTNEWGKHIVEIVVKATDYSVGRWTSDASAVKFTGFTITGGSSPASAALIKRPLNILAYGDSITEGLYNLKSAADYTTGTARQSYAFMLRDLLGAEVGLVAFGGQGVSTGYVTVPAWSSAYDKLFASGTTPTRSFSAPAPDVIIINHGENDGAVSSGSWRTAATTVVNALLAATPATTMIVMLRPFSGAHAADVQYVAGHSNSPERTVYVDTTGWFNTADGAGGVHPWGYANEMSMGPRTAAAVRSALRRGATYIKKGDGTAKLISTVRA